MGLYKQALEARKDGYKSDIDAWLTGMLEQVDELNKTPEFQAWLRTRGLAYDDDQQFVVDPSTGAAYPVDRLLDDYSEHLSQQPAQAKTAGLYKQALEARKDGYNGGDLDKDDINTLLSGIMETIGSLNKTPDFRAWLKSKGLVYDDARRLVVDQDTGKGTTLTMDWLLKDYSRYLDQLHPEQARHLSCFPGLFKSKALEDMFNELTQHEGYYTSVFKHGDAGAYRRHAPLDIESVWDPNTKKKVSESPVTGKYKVNRATLKLILKAIEDDRKQAVELGWLQPGDIKRRLYLNRLTRYRNIDEQPDSEPELYLDIRDKDDPKFRYDDAVDHAVSWQKDSNGLMYNG